MIKNLNHIYRLGLKEIKSLLSDPFLVLLLVFFFTADVLITAYGIHFEVRNTTVAVVDQDHSPLSRTLATAFHPPYFQPAVNIPYIHMKRDLDRNNYTFVLVIPPHFMADLFADKTPALQLNVDATVISQAFLGSSYINLILQQTIVQNMLRHSNEIAAPFSAPIRAQFNEALNEPLYLGVSKLAIVVAILSILLPGIALLREKEHGTIEHLLVMPLYPMEIMLAKVWANLLIILLGFMVCMLVVIIGILKIHLQGSWLLLILGTVIFQFVGASFGMALTTFTRNIPEYAILCVLFLFPMCLLCGAWTPVQSMDPIVTAIMSFSPLKYYLNFVVAVVFRGAPLQAVKFNLLAMLGLGAVFFSYCALRFRVHFR